MVRSFLWPRQHGAWAILLLPFAASLALAGGFTWRSGAALAACLAAFLAEEPLLVLLRQKVRWRDRRPETERAVFTLKLAGSAGGVSGILLLWALSPGPVLAIGAGAALLLGIHLWLAVRNRERLGWLQAVAAAGLSSSALLGYLSVRGALELEAFALWAVFSLHHAAALMIVRARLEGIVASKARKPVERRYRAIAWFSQGALAAAAAAAALLGHLWVAAAFAIPLALHTGDLIRLANPRFLAIPLRRVGLREMGISGAFTALASLGLR